MNVMIIGSGGREHAIAWKLAKSTRVTHLYVAPGNPGTAALCENVHLKVDDHVAIAGFCREAAIDLVVVGPEAPLAAGLVDHLVKDGIRVFGPHKAAAQIEASKAFAKQFMGRHNIPTARFATFHEFEAAAKFLDMVDFPVVIKASGLAAGKGVILPESRDESIHALERMLIKHEFGAAGREVVIEERLTGYEVSLMAFTDGKTIRTMPPAQDYKRLLDGDQGPNTGGMGAYAPAPLCPPEVVAKITETILLPTITGLRHEGSRFAGVLFAGLMLTADGPKVLEYNCRFGDPETQAVLPLLETDLLDVLEACINGHLKDINVKWKPEAAACVVLASEGYPGRLVYGKLTQGSRQEIEHGVCFHAGTRLEGGKIVTAGGRVFGVTSWADSLEQAVQRVYASVEKISFEGMQYRRDIAWQVSASQSAPASVSPPVATYNASSGSMNAASPAVDLGTSNPSSLALRYGTNPNQSPARIYMKDRSNLPIAVLGGSPGYINLLDAFNSWQLVKELKTALGLPAAASFKHVSPAGAAIAMPLTETLRKIYFVDDLELSPLATAYARARGADRLCSFGDFIALSDPVDVSTARLIAREVSDGVIAPGYEPEALEILRKKKQGKYAIVQIDPAFEPPIVETREVYGLTFEQRRNDRPVTPADFANIVTASKNLPPAALRDLTIAWITLKYTQSNSVCFVADGQTIGVGAGQQSRIHCVRLAGQKADLWRLRQHPAVLALPFRSEIKRPERDNAIDQFLRDDITLAEKALWSEIFAEIPRQLSPDEKRAWLDGLTNVTLGSDAFFPFSESIHRAAASGVKYVLEPGGSTRDADVVAAANAYGMTMVFSGVRLFQH